MARVKCKHSVTGLSTASATAITTASATAFATGLAAGLAAGLPLCLSSLPPPLDILKTLPTTCTLCSSGWFHG